VKAVLVTYATKAFESYQAINAITGRRAGFDASYRFGPEDLEPDFVRANEEVLGAPRGAGYWLWKPWLVARELGRLDDGDVLVYADAATHFVGPIEPLVALADRSEAGVLILGEGFRESQYTKRDAFILMNCDSAAYVATPQRFASVFALRRCDTTLGFIAEYLAYARDPRILTDAPNAMGLPDYPNFIAHRHDQLTKRYEIDVPTNDLVVEGLEQRSNAVIAHTRTHVSPGRIVQQLLGRGILRPDDLSSFRVDG
jgi:hypothetical protein